MSKYGSYLSTRCQICVQILEVLHNKTETMLLSIIMASVWMQHLTALSSESRKGKLYLCCKANSVSFFSTVPVDGRIVGSAMKSTS